jgi:hypothetical protein
LHQDDAVGLIDGMQRTVSASWESTVRRLGGTAADCDAIRPAFEYPGFEYDSSLDPSL